jgi:hypothetical protein
MVGFLLGWEEFEAFACSNLADRREVRRHQFADTAAKPDSTPPAVIIRGSESPAPRRAARAAVGPNDAAGRPRRPFDLANARDEGDRADQERQSRMWSNNMVPSCIFSLVTM